MPATIADLARQANLLRLQAFNLLEQQEYEELGRDMLRGDYDGFGRVADLAVGVLTGQIDPTGALYALDLMDGFGAPGVCTQSYLFAVEGALAWGRVQFQQLTLAAIAASSSRPPA